MKIFLCVIAAILSIFTLAVPPDPVCSQTGYSVPVATDSVSTPKSYSINFSGTSNDGNPFVNCSRIVVQYTSNWSTVNNYSSSSYIFNGVQLGGGSTTYTASKNCAFVSFWSTMPYQFNYYIGVNGGILPSFMSGTTYIYRSSVSGATSFSSANLYEYVVVNDLSETVTDLSGNVYFLVQFTVPFTDVTRVETRFTTPSSSNGEYGKPLFYTFTYGLYGTQSNATDEYYDIGYEQGYNTGYSSGVQQGTTDANNTVTESSASYQAGVQQGTTDGYNNGYNAGVQQGTTDANNTVTQSSASYQAGYNAGQNSGDTFYKMVVSVLDAPVQIFLDTFNFEIFGVNASNIILSLFTLALITFIIKLLI